MKHLESTVGSIESFCYQYRLYHSATRQSQLYFMHDCDYWMPAATVYELYEFFNFFPKALTELGEAIEQQKSQEVWRKAA